MRNDDDRKKPMIDRTSKDPWKIVQTAFSTDELGNLETLFSLANGTIGFRGFFTEREPSWHPGVFLNGFYEQSPICYGEKAYGFAEHNQTIIDVPDCRYLEIYCGDERFSLLSGTVRSFRRELDLRSGILTREVCWESPSGDQLDIRWEHIISLRHRRLGAVRLTLGHAGSSPISVISSIALPEERRKTDQFDPRVAGHGSTSVLQLVSSAEIPEVGSAETASLLFRTGGSGLSLLCANALLLRDERLEAFPLKSGDDDGIPGYRIEVYETAGDKAEPVVVEKLFCYVFDSTEREKTLEQDGAVALGQGLQLGFEGLARLQAEELSRFWEFADVTIEGDDEYQKALRFNLFHLFQSAGRDGRTSLAAKGLSGSGYEGHYFWDTEIYALPFFIHAAPSIARKLLQYRISIIDRARQRAATLSERGALFPWRTINGEEASAYFPAGTAQYHINADIAYSLMQYVEITGDTGILLEGGAELMFETARFWGSLGFFSSEKQGAFCINGVTGPDEYTAIVNNNYYTNAMAARNLELAAWWYDRLQKEHPEYLQQLAERIGLHAEEPTFWKTAAKEIYLPYDPKRGICLQDDAFLEREPWNFQAAPKDRYPLLLHYHPLVIYRHQVIKQADTILAHLLLHDRVPLEQKMRDFEFYEPLTTGDSSLSACIQGIVALEIGKREIGRTYAGEAAFVDLENIQGNTRDGLHTASMAGSWMLTISGFAGLRMNRGVPSILPQGMPEHWSRLRFTVRTPSGPVRVGIGREETVYQLVPEPEDTVNGPAFARGAVTEVVHRGRRIQVGTDPVRVSSRPRFCGAVFDLDGVVASTDEYHYRAWKELADSRGWFFDREVNQRLRGISRRDSLAVILEVNSVHLSEAEMQELMDRKNHRYRDSLEQLSSADILPGAAELLAELADKGIRSALASASRNADYILDRLGLRDAFACVVPAAEVIVGKPDPEMYLRAARGIECLPDECVGFEDAEAGVRGILAAGMAAVGIGEAVAEVPCSLHARDLRELSLAVLAALIT